MKTYTEKDFEALRLQLMVNATNSDANTFDSVQYSSLLEKLVRDFMTNPYKAKMQVDILIDRFNDKGTQEFVNKVKEIIKQGRYN